MGTGIRKLLEEEKRLERERKRRGWSRRLAADAFNLLGALLAIVAVAAIPGYIVSAYSFLDDQIESAALIRSDVFRLGIGCVVLLIVALACYSIAVKIRRGEV